MLWFNKNKIKITQSYTTKGELVIGDNFEGENRTIILSNKDKKNGKVIIIHDCAQCAEYNNIFIRREGDTNSYTWCLIVTNGGSATIYSDGKDWYQIGGIYGS